MGDLAWSVVVVVSSVRCGVRDQGPIPFGEVAQRKSKLRGLELG